jgi:hypothetical protein
VNPEAAPSDPTSTNEPPDTPSSWGLRIAFALAALAFVGTGVLHAVRGISRDPADSSSPTRHAVFVGLNLLTAAGLLLRPRWFVFPFAALVLQQLHGHGGRALADLQASGAPRAEDVVVVLAMPLLLGLLVADRRAQATRPT